MFGKIKLNGVCPTHIMSHSLFNMFQKCPFVRPKHSVKVRGWNHPEKTGGGGTVGSGWAGI